LRRKFSFFEFYNFGFWTRLVTFVYFTGTWIINLKYRKLERQQDPAKFYGGNFRFLTDINHQLTFLAVGFSLLGKILQKKKLSICGSWLQGSLVFPLSVVISVIFWTAFLISPDKTYTGASTRPFWLCHAQHSHIVLSVLIEAAQFPHSTLWKSSKPLSIFMTVYACWLIHVFRATGIWVYPFFPLLPSYIDGLLIMLPLTIPVSCFLTKICNFYERFCLAVRENFL